METLPLAELIARARRGDHTDTILGYSDRICLVRRIAEAVMASHARGVVHGRLTPRCVHVSPLGGVDITEWGSAQELDPESASYQAPERVRGQAADAAGDAYAIGAILWELLVLRPPLVVEENLARFWKRKRDGDVDAVSVEVRQSVPSDLLAAARRAIASQREDRWADLGELSSAIGLWLRRVESVAVTIQAEQIMAGQQSDDSGVRRAAAGFQSALALWPGNTAAESGFAATQAVQAIGAIRSGDATTAAAYIPASGPAQLAVTAEFGRLRRCQRRGRVVRASLVLAACCIIAAVVSASWWMPLLRSSIWQGVAEWEASPGRQFTGLVSTAGDVQVATQVPTPAGTSFILPVGRMVWLEGVDGRGDVRVTVEGAWRDRVDALEVMIGIPRINLPAGWMSPPGYSGQFGAADGSQTFVSASPHPGRPMRPSPVQVPYRAGTRYALTMEKRGDVVRLLIDGREVYRQRSIIPIGDSRSRWIALRSAGEIDVRRIAVEKPLRTQDAGVLGTADALAGSGHHEDALAAYGELLRRLPPGADRDLALVKAHLMASLLPERDGERSRLFTRASTQLAASPLLFDVMQAEAVCRWRRQDWQGAMSLAQAVQVRNPHERCGLALLEQRLPNVPDYMGEPLLELVKASSDVSYLDVSGLGLRSIAPLRGMQLAGLDLAGNRIEDLSPLSGMPLVQLDITGNQVSDIAVLKGMPLSSLRADGNRIARVDALAGMRLRQLSLVANRISEIGALAGMPLEDLDISGNPVADIAPLASCQRLAVLRLADTRIADVSPLAQPSLRELDLTRAPVADVAPLSRTGLRVLRLDGTRVADIGRLPLATLERLYLRGTPCADVAGLKGAHLAELDLGGTPLAALDGIEGIAFSAKAHLALDGTGIDAVAPLAGLGIASITLARTRVADVAPLSGSTINRLDLGGTPVSDLSPLLTVVGLRDIGLWEAQVTPDAIDAFADELERRHHTDALIQRLRAQAAYRARDWRRLRGMAVRIGRAHRLVMGVELPLAEARAVASAAGAHLPCLRDDEDLRALRELRGQASWIWLGLAADRAQPRKLAWDDPLGASEPARWMRPGAAAAHAAAYRLACDGEEAVIVPAHSTDAVAGLVLEW